ncbi:MAG: glutamate-5-semialdehyde dehydrogenase [Pelagibacteraceae bacterium]
MKTNNYLDQLGKRAVIAFNSLADLNEKQKNKTLNDYILELKKNKKKILQANALDIKLARSKKIKENIIERSVLNNDRIDSIIKSIREVIKLKDPTKKILSSWKRPNGLIIQRISMPIGVIGVIYEARPNVTADISILCFKSGNCAILRGGTEAFHSNTILSALFRKVLKKNKINPDCIQLVNKTSRDHVDYLLSSMKSYIDVIVPRGGKGLVKKVLDLSKVPVIGHLEGLCHVYIDSGANLEMAKKVVLNAKLRRTSICGAAETLLIHKKIIKTHLVPIINILHKNNCKIIGDKLVKKYFPLSTLAKEQDWKTEYLDAIISVKIVNSIDEAIAHIKKYGTNHTESIITQNKKNAQKFLNEINSSIVMHNTSTQFADGYEFGLGAEVGISTNKLHPRGPVGLEQLTSYKYIVKGNGQIRP